MKNIDINKLSVLDKLVLVGVGIYVVWMLFYMVSQIPKPLYLDPVTENVA